ncbi:MAG: 2-phospho-L-lactate transferase CofD family protein, partial [Oscillospiraceae bacterium]|nr:2-phospho-L-lactate transferase CofD family protein [Oscillospiraceae bacterium]
IPNLLVEGVAETIAESSALKIYIGNVMTQEGETEGYTNADHIQAIFEHSLPGLFHLCLVNSATIPADITVRYAQEGAEPLRADKAACAGMGVELVSRPVSMVRDGYVRHDPELLAAALLELHAQRSVRIAGLGRYRAE